MKTILFVMLSLIPAYSFSADFKVSLSGENENNKGQFIAYADEKGNGLTQAQVDQILSKNSHRTITRYVLVPAQRSLRSGLHRKADVVVEGSVIAETLDIPNDHYDNYVETITILVRDFN